MKHQLIRSTLFAAIAAACGMASASMPDTVTITGAKPLAEAVAACEQPVIPAYSTSTTAVRRVQVQIVKWQQCANGYLAKDGSEAALATMRQMSEDIQSRKDAWLVRTVQYNNGQANGRMMQTQVERDWRESVTRTAYKYTGYRYVAPRPDYADYLRIDSVDE